MQVEPMKSKLTAPGTKRLKLKYDNLLSFFAFKLNSRRYKQHHATPQKVRHDMDLDTTPTAGAYTHSDFGSTCELFCPPFNPT